MKKCKICGKRCSSGELCNVHQAWKNLVFDFQYCIVKIFEKFKIVNYNGEFVFHKFKLRVHGKHRYLFLKRKYTVAQGVPIYHEELDDFIKIIKEIKERWDSWTGKLMKNQMS